MNEMATERDLLIKRINDLENLARDLVLIMPGWPGHGDISREERTAADFITLIPRDKLPDGFKTLKK